MAASIPGDGVPGKLERARSSLHTLAGSALLIGSTVMGPDNTAEELPKLSDTKTNECAPWP